jgi:predicted metal-dependent hydrolase
MRIRKMFFGYQRENNEAVPVLWGGSLVFTCIMNAVSVTTPEAEKFFISSVNAFRAQVQDTELKKRLGIFIGQEKWHTEAHNQLNAFIVESGFAIEKLAKIAKRDFLNAILHSPEDCLALTAASEHYTAMLSSFLLKNQKIVSIIDPQFRKIWIQHSVEELEHKSVAFDLLNYLNIGYWTRVKGMVWATWNVSRHFAGGTLFFVSQNKENRSAFLEILQFLFNWNNGFMWHFIPEFLAYFLPSFHPSQIDDEALVKKYILEYNLDETIKAA